jgi:hypothetical protein
VRLRRWPSLVLLLAKAAFDPGSKLPCKLSAPKRTRERGTTRRPKSLTPVEQPQRLGQMRFDAISERW